MAMHSPLRPSSPRKYALTIFTWLLLAISLIRPVYPEEQTLQHAPTIAALIILIVESRKNRLSFASFACITAFIWLHILGARYIYSFVPYDELAFRLTGMSLADLFGWNRNHYDRLVHLLFGCLFIVPAAEVGETYGKMPRAGAVAFAVVFVVSLSALYEIFEWLLTVVMAPQHAEAYNGQQGDHWDAQKDMALALCGALGVASSCLLRRSVRRCSE